jgi:hypothetical protein
MKGRHKSDMGKVVRQRCFSTACGTCANPIGLDMPSGKTLYEPSLCYFSFCGDAVLDAQHTAVATFMPSLMPLLPVVRRTKVAISVLAPRQGFVSVACGNVHFRFHFPLSRFFEAPEPNNRKFIT